MTGTALLQVCVEMGYMEKGRCDHCRRQMYCVNCVMQVRQRIVCLTVKKMVDDIRKEWKIWWKTVVITVANMKIRKHVRYTLDDHARYVGQSMVACFSVTEDDRYV